MVRERLGEDAQTRQAKPPGPTFGRPDPNIFECHECFLSRQHITVTKAHANQVTMADLDERPSKIRKLEQSSLGAESSPNDSPSLDLESHTNSHPVEDEAETEERGTTEVSQLLPTESTPPLSKSQLKKLRKSEQWAAGKEYRKQLQKEKHKEKQARKAEERAVLKAKIAKGEIPKPTPPVKNHPRRPIQVPVSIVLDCDFNEFMAEKEIISLAAQITRSYSDNRTSPYRTHFAITSWGGMLKSRFENVLASNHLSWKGVRFFEDDYISAAKQLDGIMRGPEGGKLVGALAPKVTPASDEFKASMAPVNGTSELSTTTTGNLQPSGVGASLPVADAISGPNTSSTDTKPDVKIEIEPDIKSEIKSEVKSEDDPDVKSEIKSEDAPAEASLSEHEPSIIYLSSDSPNTLDVLSPNTIYIVGGIVDKNRHKGLCYKRARELGITTAKLPIGDYMTMQSRSVLAVNHVVEIMLKWLEKGDWGEAFLAVIPKRKEAKLKVEKGSEQPRASGKVVKGEISDVEESDGNEKQIIG